MESAFIHDCSVFQRYFVIFKISFCNNVRLFLCLLYIHVSWSVLNHSPCVYCKPLCMVGLYMNALVIAVSPLPLRIFSPTPLMLTMTCVLRRHQSDVWW